MDRDYQLYTVQFENPPNTNWDLIEGMCPQTGHCEEKTSGRGGEICHAKAFLYQKSYGQRAGLERGYDFAYCGLG